MYRCWIDFSLPPDAVYATISIFLQRHCWRRYAFATPFSPVADADKNVNVQHVVNNVRHATLAQPGLALYGMAAARSLAACYQGYAIDVVDATMPPLLRCHAAAPSPRHDF